MHTNIDDHKTNQVVIRKKWNKGLVVNELKLTTIYKPDPEDDSTALFWSIRYPIIMHSITPLSG